MTTQPEPLTDKQYELADDIGDVLDRRPDKWFTPSEVARSLKADTTHIRPILQWMARSQYVEANRIDLNSLTHYRARQWGRVSNSPATQAKGNK